MMRSFIVLSAVFGFFHIQSNEKQFYTKMGCAAESVIKLNCVDPYLKPLVAKVQDLRESKSFERYVPKEGTATYYLLCTLATGTTFFVTQEYPKEVFLVGSCFAYGWVKYADLWNQVKSENTAC